MSTAAAERALLHHGGNAGRWGNLGLWPVDAGAPACDYATACAALARAVGRAAGLGPGQRVLSLACGAGDELALWVEEFGVAHALGIERDLDANGAVAAHRAAAGTAPRVQWRAGDATRPAVPAASVDAVTCVDAAYHFAPRAAWLDAVRAALRPGGRLAFTDLVLEPATGASTGPAPSASGSASGSGSAPTTLATRAWGRPWLRSLLLPLVRHGAAGAGIELAELVSPERAVARVAAAGFEDVRLERLDDAVLGGFARFVAEQTRRLGDGARTPAWRRPRRTAALIGPCRAAGLGYALLSATAA